MNCELERMWPWYTLRYCLNVCLEGLRKVMKHLSWEVVVWARSSRTWSTSIYHYVAMFGSFVVARRYGLILSVVIIICSSLKKDFLFVTFLPQIMILNYISVQQGFSTFSRPGATFTVPYQLKVIDEDSSWKFCGSLLETVLNQAFCCSLVHI